MIIVPRSMSMEWQRLASFLHRHAKVSPSQDMVFFAWVSEGGKLQMVVAIDGFLGKTAQINVAMAPDFHFVPRGMLREVFHYAFETAQREMLLGVLNSNNAKAMRFDRHLGFREIARLPGMHEGGGDFVVMGMKKNQCRYLERNNGQEIRSATAA